MKHYHILIFKYYSKGDFILLYIDILYINNFNRRKNLGIAILHRNLSIVKD